jgi:hypothetical protein
MMRQWHPERKPEETSCIAASHLPVARGGLATPAGAGMAEGQPAEEEPLPGGEESPTGSERTASA